MAPTPTPSQEQSIQDLLGKVTWEEIVADGIVTTEEIDAALKAKGYDPEDLMHLYE